MPLFFFHFIFFKNPWAFVSMLRIPSPCLWPLDHSCFQTVLMTAPKPVSKSHIPAPYESWHESSGFSPCTLRVDCMGFPVHCVNGPDGCFWWAVHGPACFYGLKIPWAKVCLALGRAVAVFWSVCSFLLHFVTCHACNKFGFEFELHLHIQGAFANWCMIKFLLIIFKKNIKKYQILNNKN